MSTCHTSLRLNTATHHSSSQRGTQVAGQLLHSGLLRCRGRCLRAASVGARFFLLAHAACPRGIRVACAQQAVQKPYPFLPVCGKCGCTVRGRTLWLASGVKLQATALLACVGGGEGAPPSHKASAMRRTALSAAARWADSRSDSEAVRYATWGWAQVVRASASSTSTSPLPASQIAYGRTTPACAAAREACELHACPRLPGGAAIHAARAAAALATVSRRSRFSTKAPVHARAHANAHARTHAHTRTLTHPGCAFGRSLQPRCGWGTGGAPHARPLPGRRPC